MRPACPLELHGLDIMVGHGQVVLNGHVEVEDALAPNGFASSESDLEEPSEAESEYSDE